MQDLYSFSASGTCDDIELLHTVLKNNLPLLNGSGKISGYRMTQKYNSENERNNILLFCTNMKEKGYQPYPYVIDTQNGTDIMLLVSHIMNYIDNLTNEDLIALGCEPEGDEEDYEIGWEIYTPDWYSETYGVEDYSEDIVLAVKPKFLEYGK